MRTFVVSLLCEHVPLKLQIFLDVLCLTFSSSLSLSLLEAISDPAVLLQKTFALPFHRQVT